MKQILFSLVLTPFLANFAQANDIIEPDLNQCNANKNIKKCEIVCKRKLGEQCLITHINFEGSNLKPKTQLLRAKFKTCKNANLDLQIKSLAIELEKLDERETQAKITSSISASGKRVRLNTHAPIEFNEAKIDGRLSRIYFNKLISSGESFVESEITLQQCGHEDSTNRCSISGTLVAVTDPNIRCDFHDTSQAGAYLPSTFKFSPDLYSGQHPVGRTGE